MPARHRERRKVEPGTTPVADMGRLTLPATPPPFFSLSREGGPELGRAQTLRGAAILVYQSEIGD